MINDVQYSAAHTGADSGCSLLRRAQHAECRRVDVIMFIREAVSWMIRPGPDYLPAIMAGPSGMDSGRCSPASRNAIPSNVCMDPRDDFLWQM